MSWYFLGLHCATHEAAPRLTLAITLIQEFQVPCQLQSQQRRRKTEDARHIHLGKLTWETELSDMLQHYGGKIQKFLPAVGDDICAWLASLTRFRRDQGLPSGHADRQVRRIQPAATSLRQAPRFRPVG